MKVSILNKKMIKPYIPTPQNLKNYNISLTDKLAPSMNVPIILFYSSLPPCNDFLTTIEHLQQSLANVLPRFYPLAGRYVRKDHLVHCNDEGIEFVEAHACSDDFENISDYVESGKHEQLNDVLLPRLSCEVDEVADPIVSIQVTRFGCGGLAIGLSVSHRIVDADSISTFIRAWVEEATSNHSLKEGESKPIVNPTFDSPKLLPFKNFFAGWGDIQLSRTIDPNVISKRFLFNKDAIATLKAKIMDRSRRVSKVNVVCALISKAMIRVDRLKHGRPRNSLIAQAVNIRNRTIPPFPKSSCGNLVAQAMLKLCPSYSSDDDRNLNVEFEDLVFLLRDSIDKTMADCAGVFKGSDDEGHAALYDSVMDLIETIMSKIKEINVFFFSDWSKCDFYKADFGWGKPISTSIATMRVENLAVLMDNKEGNGIEAWVQLFKEDMVLFEQDEDIIRLDASKV